MSLVFQHREERDEWRQRSTKRDARRRPIRWQLI